MQKHEKGEMGYLGYRKQMNLIKMAVAFGVVFAVLAAGFLIFKNRANILTVLSIVLVLPAAKMGVGYFVLLPHKAAEQALFEAVEKNAAKLGRCYDCIFSNSKSPIGAQAVVVTDSVVCALTDEEKADAKLFETSVQEFLKNDKRHVTVTLYKEKKAFLNRIHNLSVQFGDGDEEALKKIELNMASLKAMCL